MTARRFIVEPRGVASLRVRVMVPVLSVIAALVVGAIFLAITGNNPAEVYVKMVDSSFGTGRRIAETLLNATPLILTGIAAAIAFKMLVWNIGGEGQLLMGAVFAAGIGIALGSGAPAAVAIPAVVIAGAVGGAFWASASALPRVYLGTNEIITTLMLNFIALNLVNYLILDSFSPWRDAEVAQFPTGREIPDAARLPEFFNRLDYGIFIAVAIAIAAWLLIEKTRWGFELRVVGDSPMTARYAGIPVPRKILTVFLLSGAFAGTAGALLVSGPLGSLDDKALNIGLGFTGIIVAALARLNALAVIPVAVLLGGFNQAGPALQTINVPDATVVMLQGAILIFAVGGEFLIANRLRRPEKEPTPGGVEPEPGGAVA